MIYTMKKGKLIIISAPSGSGKSTIIGKIIGDPDLRLSFSVSATTREPRAGEEHGVHYYFLSVEEFKSAIASNSLVEYEEGYPGLFYGTLKSEVERIQQEGRNVILDIDVKGGVNVKKLYGNDSLAIFIQPPSVEELRKRLIARATDPIEAINQRVSKAEFEIGFAPQFAALVINDVLGSAVEKTRSLISQFVNS